MKLMYGLIYIYLPKKVHKNLINILYLKMWVYLMKNINFFISLVGIYYENSNFAYNNIDHKKIPPLFFISEYSEFFC